MRDTSFFKRIRKVMTAAFLPAAVMTVCLGMCAAGAEGEGEGMDAPGMEDIDWIEEELGQNADTWEENVDTLGNTVQIDQMVPEGEWDNGGNDVAEEDMNQEEWSWDEVGDSLLELSGDESSVHEGLTASDLARTQAMEEARQKAASLESSILILPQADPEKISEYLEELTSMESPTGSDGELIIGDYIMTKMEEFGYQVNTQEFHEGFMNDDMIDVPGMNIIAERIGNSDLSDGRYILVVAHYDSKTDPDPEDPFANDKTSAAALLEIGRILSEYRTADNLVFLFLSGEEDGFFGSQSFVDYLDDSIKPKVDGVICLGRLGYDKEMPYIIGTYDSEPGEIGQNLMAAAVLESDRDLFNLSVADTETARVFFATDNMPAVDLFQDVSGYYSELTGYEPASEAETNVVSSNSGSHVLAGDPDPEALAQITDVLARCVSFYVDPTQIYGDVLYEEDEWEE